MKKKIKRGKNKKERKKKKENQKKHTSSVTAKVFVLNTSELEVFFKIFAEESRIYILPTGK